MRVTKLSHATLRVDVLGQTLVVDPGMFTEMLTDIDHLVGVVITHEHPDHWTNQHLAHLRAVSPEVPIFAPESVAGLAEEFGVRVVAPGDAVSVGAFQLRFFGGTHAVIHSSIPVVQNVGVLVNDTFYYPGDSYAVPEGVTVHTLAAPLGAPWLKIGDAMDFVLAVRPRQAFGTHDMTLSDAGRGMHRERLRWATEQHGGTFYELNPGDSIDVSSLS